MTQATKPDATKPQRPAPARWYCCACGRLSAIGDKPVARPCRCGD